MIARLRVALAVGAVVGAVGFFIVTVVFPDPSSLLLSSVIVATGLTVTVLSVAIQRRRGLR